MGPCCADATSGAQVLPSHSPNTTAPTPTMTSSSPELMPKNIAQSQLPITGIAALMQRVHFIGSVAVCRSCSRLHSHSRLAKLGRDLQFAEFSYEVVLMHRCMLQIRADGLRQNLNMCNSCTSLSSCCSFWLAG